MSVDVASIDVPDEVRSGDYEVVLSISGGKDSTATALALREAGVSYRMVFADTGWEADETYRHLDHLREKLGPIDVVGHPGGMLDKVRERGGFPARTQRWCTRELKLRPLRKYHDAIIDETGRDTVSVVGIRASESETRAKMAVFEDDDTWKGWIWRPLLSWGIEQVLAIHHRHGVEVNPLYKKGFDRVGCFPCIFASKSDIRLMADTAPERVIQLGKIERETTEIRRLNNETGRRNNAHEQATFFQSRTVDAHGKYKPMWIEEVVEWARTARGGKQMMLLPPPPDSGCFRWGMCEAPSLSAQEEKNSNKET